MNIQKTLLERLESKGTIVIMDKEAGDFSITVKPQNIEFVRSLLDIELGTANYEMEYKSEFQNYEIDFNINEHPKYGIEIKK